jgi:hypothetical protein
MRTRDEYLRDAEQSALRAIEFANRGKDNAALSYLCVSQLMTARALRVFEPGSEKLNEETSP